MMNAASVLLSSRCEYTRFLGIRSLRSTEQMRFCGIAQCNFMSWIKEKHVDHVLVFTLRVARSTILCYMRLPPAFSWCRMPLFLMLPFRSWAMDRAVERRDNGIEITHTKTQQTKMKAHVNVALCGSLCGYLPRVECQFGVSGPFCHEHLSWLGHIGLLDVLPST